MSEPLHLNTPRRIANQSQQTVWKMDNTEAFGDSTPNENPSNLGTFEFNQRFPGQYADKETGLAYNYFRDYNAALGRYTQSDPIGLRGGINTYLYVGGNPLSKIDPYGLAECPGGIWDQEFGDFALQAAAGIFGQVANINLTCRGKPSLKCRGKQACIGGGPMLGVGASWALGGATTAASTSQIGGWGGWNASIGAGIISGQAGVEGDGGQTSIGPNFGWKFGVAGMRCFTYQLKCTDNGCEVQ